MGWEGLGGGDGFGTSSVQGSWTKAPLPKDEEEHVDHRGDRTLAKEDRCTGARRHLRPLCRPGEKPV